MLTMEELKEHKEFDEVIQLQIDEINRSMALATNARIAICIVDTGECLQTSIHSRTSDDESVARMESIRTMCVVSGAALSTATDGAMTLLMKGPDGKITPVLPDELAAVMVKRNG